MDLRFLEHLQPELSRRLLRAMYASNHICMHATTLNEFREIYRMHEDHRIATKIALGIPYSTHYIYK